MSTPNKKPSLCLRHSKSKNQSVRSKNSKLQARSATSRGIVHNTSKKSTSLSSSTDRITTAISHSSAYQSLKATWRRHHPSYSLQPRKSIILWCHPALLLRTHRQASVVSTTTLIWNAVHRTTVPWSTFPTIKKKNLTDSSLLHLWAAIPSYNVPPLMLMPQNRTRTRGYRYRPRRCCFHVALVVSSNFLYIDGSRASA